MHTTKRMRSGLLALAAVVASFMAVSVAPAMASPHWSDTAHGIKLAGSLTVSSPGFSNETCTAPASQASIMSAESALVYSEGGPYLTFTCGASKKLQVVTTLKTQSTTAVQLYGTNSSFQTSPFGYYHQWGSSSPAVGDFTNGSGGTSSTLKFASDEIGYVEAGKGALRVSGTLTVTTSTGGLLTILP